MQHREIYREYGEAVFGMGETELYELERALRRHDRFPKTRSGPGGGVWATPQSIALLVLAALMDGPRSEIAERLDGYLGAHTEGTYLENWDSQPLPHSIPCGLTGQLKFGQALQQVFEKDENAGRVTAIRLNRSAIEAWIEYVDEKNVAQRTRFVHAGVKGRRRVQELEKAGTLLVGAVIGRGAILTLRAILKHSEGGRADALKQALAQIDAALAGGAARK